MAEDSLSSTSSPLSSLHSGAFSQECRMDEVHQKIASYEPTAPADHTALTLRAFVTNLPPDGVDNIASQIIGCGSQEDLKSLAQHLLTVLLIPIKARGPTPLPTPTPRSGGDDDFEEIASELQSISRNNQAWLKKACLARDNNQCMITGMYDENYTPSVDEPTDVRYCSTEAVHIIPFSMGNFKQTQVHQSAMIWDCLYQCFPGLRARLNFSSENINDTFNVMTMWSDLHKLWGEFRFALEDTPTLHTYRVVKYNIRPAHITDSHLPSTVTFDAHATRFDLPHPYLLKIHASIARILHMRGMAELVSQIFNEREHTRCLASDGSSNVEFLLTVS